MKMLVSRKTLSLIQFVASVLAVYRKVFHALHELIELAGTARTAGELFQPLAERRIQGGMLLSRGLAGLLDQVLIRAQGNVLHENSVHDSSAISVSTNGRTP